MAINLSDKMLSLANKNLYGNLYTLNPQKKNNFDSTELFFRNKN